MKPEKKTRSEQPIAFLALALHIVWLTVFGYIIWSKMSAVETEHWYSRPIGFFTAARADAISVASELGRLDIVSLSLTVLGVVLALSAFVTFYLMRHAVIQTTREEAETIVPDELRKHVTIEKLIEAIKSDPVLLSRLQSAAQDGTISDNQADRISKVIDEEATGDE